MFSAVIFVAFIGCAVGQFRPFPRRPGFGRFGNPNPAFIHNSYHAISAPNNNNNIPMGPPNSGMFGSMNGMGGTMGAPPTGIGAMMGMSSFPNNLLGGRERGVCPMLQGVDNMTSFRLSCSTYMMNPPRDAECTPGPFGTPCSSGSLCCPQSIGGQCSFACSQPITSPMKVGKCPTGFYDKPDPGQGWISGMCFYAQSEGMVDEAQCRFDGDCEGNQKCCSPNVDPKNLFSTCIRKCTQVL